MDWAIPKDKFEAKMNNLQEKEASSRREMKTDKGDKQGSVGVKAEGSNTRQKRKMEEDDNSNEESEAGKLQTLHCHGVISW